MPRKLTVIVVSWVLGGIEPGCSSMVMRLPVPLAVARSTALARLTGDCSTYFQHRAAVPSVVRCYCIDTANAGFYQRCDPADSARRSVEVHTGH
jgi:hypothetical protein